MWQVIINDQTHYAASPHWVRQLTALGKAVGLPVTTIRESEAQGILFGHAYYTLLGDDGEPLMQGDFATATVTRLEDWQPPEQPAPMSSDAEKALLILLGGADDELD